MIKEILFALVQSATEFLPVSSSGHLALLSKILGDPANLFFFTALHLASLLAIVIFTRKEIKNLLTFKEEYRKLWLYIILATLPAVVFVLFFNDIIEKAFVSTLFLGIAFLFTGTVLFVTRFFSAKSGLNYGKAFFVGLFQMIAVFPGVSRSGMTISSGIFAGLGKEKAAKFSFLLAIPVLLGAFIFELKNFYFDSTLLVAFIVCTLLSLLFLNLLYWIVRKGKFWWFSIYCWILGLSLLYLQSKY